MNLQRRWWMRWALGSSVVAAALARAPVAAQPRRVKVGVLSAVGDKLTIVTFQETTGSRLDRNPKRVVSIKDAPFDARVARHISQAVREAGLAASSYAAAIDNLAAELGVRATVGQRVALPQDIHQDLAADGVTHLLLVTPQRAPAALKLATTTVGDGQLEGLGFYIDRMIALKLSETGEGGKGMLAPYAYFRVSLIEMDSQTLRDTEVLTESQTVASAGAREASHPWDTMSAEEKVAALQRLLLQGVDRAVPRMLKLL